MAPEEAALRAACAAAPADDAPRLVLADWLEDAGDAPQAEFLRAAVRAASEPPWEPFPVYFRRRRPEWRAGAPWRPTLPPVDGSALAWAERPFTRGLGGVLLVRHLPELLRRGAELFDLAPVEELHLAPAALREDWAAFAAAPWLGRVRRIHFTGTGSPIEPVRALCASVRATGVEELVFHSSASPAMPVLVEGIAESPLAPRLRGLEFRVGDSDSSDLIEAICGAPFEGLRSLRLSLFGLPDAALGQLAGMQARELRHIHFDQCRLDPGGWWLTLRPLLIRTQSLGLTRCSLAARQLEEFFHFSSSWSEIRQLDLGGNAMELTAVSAAARSSAMRKLRTFGWRSGRTSRGCHRVLTTSLFWPNLVELDLRDNPLSPPAVRALLDAPAPPDLTALLAGPHGVPDSLRAKYGDALVVADAEAGL